MASPVGASSWPCSFAHLPAFGVVSEGKKHEIQVAREIDFTPGTTLVIDRGYTDYAWFVKLTQRTVHFVTRMKENANYGVVEKRELPNRRGVLRDEVIFFFKLAQAGVECFFRRIEFYESASLHSANPSASWATHWTTDNKGTLSKFGQTLRKMESIGVERALPGRTISLLFCHRRMRPYSDNKLKIIRPLLVSLKMYSPGKVFHAIRHTAGSIMLDSGASILNVQKQLRHSSATVTLTVYGHVLGNSQRNPANKLAQRLVA